MNETISTQGACAICGGEVDRWSIEISRSQISKMQARQRIWHPGAFEKYPNQVCFDCDARAVDKSGAPAIPSSIWEAHSEPVFIEGVRCWRMHDFCGPSYLTMRDDYNSENLTDFLDRCEVNRCRVDFLTPEDLEPVTGWLPQLAMTSRDAVTQSPGGADADLIYKLMHSSSTLITKVMEVGGGFVWPDWQPVAQYYVQDGDLLDSASLETCVRLLITHVRKDLFCDGHFRSMVKSGHIQRLLTRMEAIRKRLLAEGRKNKS